MAPTARNLRGEVMDYVSHQFHITTVHGTDMAPPRGSAAYKKQDGTLAISRDGQYVSWTPIAPPGSKPALSFAVSTITSESLCIRILE
ncbi:MAG: hypothetical protein LQ352_006995 [Teloschistes flavicans]|nr:MAG: hypothetical protein LQ352_006995 [Teloschistes flavicans]